jgi:hypothetical protein
MKGKKGEEIREFLPNIECGPSPCQGSVQTLKKKCWRGLLQCLIEVIDEGGQKLEKEKTLFIGQAKLERKSGKKY